MLNLEVAEVIYGIETDYSLKNDRIFIKCSVDVDDLVISKEKDKIIKEEINLMCYKIEVIFNPTKKILKEK